MTPDAPDLPATDASAVAGALSDLPGFLLDDARRFYASGAQPAPIRAAATVLLLRPPLSVYLLRRAPTMAFAAGMYVFPGGTVDPRDAETDLAWAGPPPRAWAARLGVPEDRARAVICAAVREVFEESGVLLAGPDGSTVVGDVSTPDWETARTDLLERTVGLAQLLRSRGLVLRSDLLAPWARWITPEFEPRRFDAVFFLARLPLGQVCRDVGGEADRTAWLSPNQAAGVPMLPPTRAALADLAGFDSVDAAMAAAAARGPISPVSPRAVFDQTGDLRLVIE